MASLNSLRKNEVFLSLLSSRELFFQRRSRPDFVFPRLFFAGQTYESRALPSLRQQTLPVAGGARLGVAVQQAGHPVVVTSVVAGSAADHAGLKVADVLRTVDGVTVTSPAELAAMVRLHRVGDVLHIEILRNAQRITVIATLGPA